MLLNTKHAWHTIGLTKHRLDTKYWLSTPLAWYTSCSVNQLLGTPLHKITAQKLVHKALRASVLCLYGRFSLMMHAKKTFKKAWSRLAAEVGSLKTESLKTESKWIGDASQTSPWRHIAEIEARLAAVLNIKRHFHEFYFCCQWLLPVLPRFDVS